MSNFEHLICPACKGPLNNAGNSLVCPLRHSFDIAGKGYVNLLLSQDKNSKDPGDNKDMAKARKLFLDKGYYEPLAKSLCTLFSQDLTPKKNSALTLLDAGCGDGYYTAKINKSFIESLVKCRMFGMDISKEAIRLAARRNKDIKFFVASLFKIPFETNCADFILNAFAPAHDEEFNRILKKDGALVTVIPGKRHLFNLKSILYDNPYENDEKKPVLPSFYLEEQVRIKDYIKVASQEEIACLLTMTPYYWRTPKEGVERLKKLDSLDTEIEFIIGVHRKMK